MLVVSDWLKWMPTLVPFSKTFCDKANFSIPATGDVLFKIICTPLVPLTPNGLMPDQTGSVLERASFQLNGTLVPTLGSRIHHFNPGFSIGGAGMSAFHDDDSPSSCPVSLSYIMMWNWSPRGTALRASGALIT